MHDNLYCAYFKAAKGRLSKANVIRFTDNLDENIENLRQEIITLSPDIGNYRFFWVRDPKPRYICAAAFKERVLHHAIMNICEPVLDKFAIYDCYACRVNKGTYKAIHRCQQFLRQHQWYVKLDIKKYFDSIDHNIVLGLFHRKIKDERLCLLIEKIINTYHTKPGKGLPIGNLISQHLANFYLGYFDHWIKERLKIKGYLRYMDDFVLFVRSSTEAKQLLQKVMNYLDKELTLQLKKTIQINKCAYGIPFLGYRIYPHKIGLTPDSKKRFTQKFRKYEEMYDTERWDASELVKHMDPLFAFVHQADAIELCRHVIQRFGVSS